LFYYRSIYLLDGATLKLKHVINGHDQSVECIIWHPKHVVCDYNEESKYKNYFASSSYSIRVHKLNEGINFHINLICYLLSSYFYRWCSIISSRI